MLSINSDNIAEYRLIDIIRKLKRLDISSVFADKISMPEYSTLMAIAKIRQAKDSVFVSDIVKCFEISAQAVSKYLRICEKDGLLLRRTDENDRRNTKLFLTQKGENIIAACNSDIHKFYESVLNEFSEDEVESMINTVERLYKITEKKIDEFSH